MPTTLVLTLVALSVVALWLLRERWRLLAEARVLAARGGDVEQQRATFQALASEALRHSNEEFLRLAQTSFAAQRGEATLELERRRAAVEALVTPVARALERTQAALEQVGRDQAGLRGEILRMHQASHELRGETGRLVQALRKPNVRGRYGEVQLERVVELAGMRSYCDFTPQAGVRDEDGRLARPDLVVRLPNARIVAVDAKTNVDAYLDALDAQAPEEAERHLERYAEIVMLQAQKLSRKEYWAHFEASPEFVVMFLPGDQLVDAALQRRPDLIDYAAQKNVVIASPSTLIGLLRAVHVGWREKNLSESARELFELGRELHQRAAIALEHGAAMGDALERARKSYNDFVASVDARLMPTLRKFEERGARSAKALPTLRRLEGEVRRAEPLPPLAEIELPPARPGESAGPGLVPRAGTPPVGS